MAARPSRRRRRAQAPTCNCCSSAASLRLGSTQLFKNGSLWYPVPVPISTSDHQLSGASSGSFTEFSLQFGLDGCCPQGCGSPVRSSRGSRFRQMTSRSLRVAGPSISVGRRRVVARMIEAVLSGWGGHCYSRCPQGCPQGCRMERDFSSGDKKTHMSSGDPKVTLYSQSGLLRYVKILHACFPSNTIL